MKRIFATYITICIVSGCLAGCTLSRETVLSAGESAASGAASGFVTGGPIGALIGGLGGLLTGGAAAMQQRRGRDKVIAQLTNAIGHHVESAPLTKYNGHDAQYVLKAERDRLLAALSMAMDTKGKAMIAKHHGAMRHLDDLPKDTTHG